MISIFLVEYMNRITFGASDLASPFFTPGVFLFKISMLFDAIKLSHISSCRQLHTGMYNIYIYINGGLCLHCLSTCV